MNKNIRNRLNSKSKELRSVCSNTASSISFLLLMLVLSKLGVAQTYKHYTMDWDRKDVSQSIISYSWDNIAKEYHKKYNQIIELS